METEPATNITPTDAPIQSICHRFRMADHAPWPVTPREIAGAAGHILQDALTGCSSMKNSWPRNGGEGPNDHAGFVDDAPSDDTCE